MVREAGTEHCPSCNPVIEDMAAMVLVGIDGEVETFPSTFDTLSILEAALVLSYAWTL